MESLELIILVKPHKRVEFKQSLDNLYEKLQKRSTSLKISESENCLSCSIIAEWETAVQMQEALKIEEFVILSGAVKALCENTIIRLNDKKVGNHISKLKTL